MVREIERGSKSTRARISEAARSLAASLVRKAGRALTSSSGSFEALEDRRLMFTLTVGQSDINPLTGLGTVTASFAYAIPYFGPVADPQAGTGQTELIDFNDVEEDMQNGWARRIAGIQNGRVALADSALCVESTWFTDNFYWAATDDDQRVLAVTRPSSGVGRSITYSFTSLAGNAAAPAVKVQQFAIQVGQGWREPNPRFGNPPATPGSIDPTDIRGMVNADWEVEIEFGALEPGTSNRVVRRYSGGQFDRLFDNNNVDPTSRFSTGNLLNNVMAVADINDGLHLSGIYSVKFICKGDTNSNPVGFTFDNAELTPFGAANLPRVAPRLFGATVELTGPLNASVEVLDLYGRDMVQTLLALPSDALDIPFALIDDNDDGIPDYNEGIGRINIRGSDARTSFAIRGGELEVGTTPPDDAVDSQQDFPQLGSFHSITALDDLNGLMDLFLAGGFGYERLPSGALAGLPPVGASVIIGSPWLRDITGNSANYGLGADVPRAQFNFQNPNQGIFVEGNIGRIAAHAILHGSSRINGFVDDFNVGYMVGSLRVDGDVGSAIFGTDAGMWWAEGTNDSDLRDNSTGGGREGIFRTGSQFVVGRTVGSLLVAGRNQMNVTVQGDLNAPDESPARGSANYDEKEFVGLPGVDEPGFIDIATAGTELVSFRDLGFGRAVSMPFVWGGVTYRNDSISAAEFISTGTSGVRVRGELSGTDALNQEDTADVYAFTARKGQRISAQVVATTAPQLAPYIRIVDYRGRTLAAANTPFGAGDLFASAEVRWTPESDGVYYIVLTDPRGSDDDGGPSGYTMAVAGMAPVNFGEYRTGGGAGGFRAEDENNVTLLNGDLGIMRIGAAILSGDGAEIDPSDLTNIVADDADDLMTLMAGAYTFRGNVYQIWTGSDIGLNPNAVTQTVRPVRMSIGGDLHQFYTGQSETAGGSANEGDVNFFQLRTGGRIGEIKISGGIGMDQDADDARARVSTVSNHVQFITGTNGRGGDIGMLRLGSHMFGGSMLLDTPDGSTIGAFLISQDKYYGDRPGDGRFGLYRGVDSSFETGFGSDVLFFDVPRYDRRETERDDFTVLANDSFVEFTDDSGATVEISLAGADPAATGNIVRVVPMDGSLGFGSIAEIVVDLTGVDGDLTGASLRIRGSDEDAEGRRIGISRITIVGASASSTISIEGNIEIDVYQIIQTGGDGLQLIQNITPGGDIVAVDVPSLNEIRVRGNLGSTFVNSVIGTMTGPFVGFGQGNGDEGENPFALPQGPFDDDFNGSVFRPIQDDDFDQQNAYLDDIGGPFDGWLSGIVVRTGNIQNVNVDGSVGDVLCLNGIVVNINANADFNTAPGSFDGIVGTVFGTEIIAVDLGDGLIAPDGPLARAGIFATDDIGSIQAFRTESAVIRGVISASNSVALADEDVDGDPDPTVPVPVVAEGIQNIYLQNASLIDAFINVNSIDRFWNGYAPTFSDDSLGTGRINSVFITNSVFYRTRIDGDRLGDFFLQDTDFDASQITMRGLIDRISVRSFKNSTLNGDDFEREENLISTGGNILTLAAAEDMSDLRVDLLGSITGSLSARNITRSEIEVDNEIRVFNVTQDVRGSEIRVGKLRNLNVGRNIGNSSISLSGDVTKISAGDSIFNSSIEVTGPAANLRNLSAPNLIQGRIAVAGPIGTVTVARGSLNAQVITTTALGNVGTLSAGLDLAIDTEISGTIGTLSAGRHIGSADAPRVILSSGNISAVTGRTGQLYADIRSGGSVGRVSVAGGINKPGQSNIGFGSIIAFGAINSVSSIGDFGGDIISYSGGIKSVTIKDGSLLSTSQIAAYDGTVGTVSITNGNLYGSIHADVDITSINVTADRAGVFGDVGVNPGLSAGAAFDANRNQLPANVAADIAINGPRITAGQHIGKFNVPGGDVFETFIWAGQQIKSLTVGGSIRNDGITAGTVNVIAAGDSIVAAKVTGFVSNAAILGGVISFGADGKIGGVGDNADSVISGEVKSFIINGGTSNVIVSAGINPGVDGLYNTADDLQVPGLGGVRALTVTGAVAATSVFGDSLPAALFSDPRGFILGGYNAAVLTAAGDPQDEVATRGSQVFGNQFATLDGVVTFTLSGPGSLFYNSILNKVTLVGSNTTTKLTMNFSAVFDNFDFVTSEDASVGTLVFNGDFDGDSDFMIDGSVQNMTIRSIDGFGTVRVGETMKSANFTRFSGGTLQARELSALTVTGDFGSTAKLVQGEAIVRATNAGKITVNGVMRGDISVDRSISALTLGAAEAASIRAGRSIGGVTSGRFSESNMFAGDGIGSVKITGNLESAMILAGYDAGVDAAFGGEGANADVLSSGSIASIAVTGDFRATSIGAGYAPGTDGYLGTTDDRIAPGRSDIGAVTYTGLAIGSTRGSEQYRIAASGRVTSFKRGTATFVPTGNLRLESPLLSPAPLQVDFVDVDTSGRVFKAVIKFNQPIDFTSITQGMNIREVRGSGDATIRLAEGFDYSVENRPLTNEIIVTFNPRVTGADQPNVPGTPGPGVYRFEFDQSKLRAKLSGIRLDGDGDGFEDNGDNYSQDSVVGDAGDKITAPADGTVINGERIDFYGPINLDVMLDNNAAQDRLVDINLKSTVTGFLGDHPDHITGLFDFAEDVDVYSLTIQAGQILRLGALQGAAAGAILRVHAADGTPLDTVTASNLAQSLPGDAERPTDISFPLVYLIKVTGTYYISVSNLDDSAEEIQDALTNTDNPVIPDVGVDQSAAVGDYSFSIELFDDGNTGFNSSTDSGDGEVVVDPPSIIAFAGVDGIFGTSDDRATIQQGDFLFTLDRGRDRIANTSDDIVRGDNGENIFLTREFNGTIRRSIFSSIGPRGSVGIPGSVTPDADVFHLNDRLPITPGTKMRATIKLVGSGSDLGGINATLGLDQDNRGSVQFALFETTGSTGFDDVSLVFSPTEFAAAGGTPNRVLADNGVEKYGFDANGDYYIEFLVPQSVVGSGAGSFALFIQGVYNTDYAIQLDTIGTGTRTTVRQNVLIEVDGGSIDWLEVGGFGTNLNAFDPGTLGFTGTVDGFQSVRDYIVAGLVDRLNSIYREAGVDVIFSSNASDFRFQPFSTVYLSSLMDPVSPLINLPSGVNSRIIEELVLDGNLDILSRPFGFSQRSDPLNINLTDEAVVFLPSFALLGLDSGNAGVDQLIQSLTAAVGRRVGELVGLRMTENIELAPVDANGDAVPVVFDIMGANSPSAFLEVDQNDETLRFLGDRRSLSTSIDSIDRTNFYFGQQNSISLLRRNLRSI